MYEQCMEYMYLFHIFMALLHIIGKDDHKSMTTQWEYWQNDIFSTDRHYIMYTVCNLFISLNTEVANLCIKTIHNKPTKQKQRNTHVKQIINQPQCLNLSRYTNFIAHFKSTCQHHLLRERTPHTCILPPRLVKTSCYTADTHNL